jgi:hypothetical protein
MITFVAAEAENFNRPFLALLIPRIGHLSFTPYLFAHT